MRIRYVVVAVLLMLLPCQTVYAGQEECPVLLHNQTDEKAIHLFVKGIEDPDEISCRFGRQVCSEIGWHSLTELGEERETLVLIDNSLSTGRRYRERIETVVLELFENASENEKFCVASFGETIEYLTEFTNLYTPLEEAVLGIEYCDRDTYLTDAVMEAADHFNMEEKPSVYRRIVVITDGQETASHMHTHEELFLRLKENAYPVYMIGCCNEKALDYSHMSVISRMTGADSYAMDRETDLKDIALSLLEDRDVLHITLIPEEERMDGSRISARLTFLKQGVITGLDTVLEMPFAPATVKEEATPVPEPEVTVLPSPEPVPQSEKPAGGTGAFRWALGAACIMLGVLIVSAMIYLLIQRKKQTSGKTSAQMIETGRLYHDHADEWNRCQDRNTQLLCSDDSDRSETTVLFGDEEICEITLTDQSNPSKFFSIPVRDSIIIGRNARSSNVVLDYDDSVSGRHCEIENRGGRFFVKDLQSSNGTRVNGIKVLSEAELFSGNLLKLGALEMKVGWNLHG